MLSVLGWAETMRFGSSSTEMVQTALRMARATTGRTGIVRFHGHYHGWIDNIYTRNEGTEAAPAQQAPARVRAYACHPSRVERHPGV